MKKHLKKIGLAVLILAMGVLAVFAFRPKEPYADVSTGMIVLWTTGTPPLSFHICDGSAISRTTYSNLFNKIGTTFGVGDGSTTFNLPDMRQRFVMGVAASGTGNTLAATGGTIDHDHGSPITSDGPSDNVAATNLTGSAASTTHTHDVTLTAQNPPFITLYYIIKQ